VQIDRLEVEQVECVEAGCPLAFVGQQPMEIRQALRAMRDRLPVEDERAPQLAQGRDDGDELDRPSPDRCATTGARCRRPCGR
jgi:hypothetical protein